MIGDPTAPVFVGRLSRLGLRGIQAPLNVQGAPGLTSFVGINPPTPATLTPSPSEGVAPGASGPRTSGGIVAPSATGGTDLVLDAPNPAHPSSLVGYSTPAVNVDTPYATGGMSGTAKLIWIGLGVSAASIALFAVLSGKKKKKGRRG